MVTGFARRAREGIHHGDTEGTEKEETGGRGVGGEGECDFGIGDF